MSKRAGIPDAVRKPQEQASNPETSVFVAANAGSGKTYVLVNRVIRLLLQGTPPEKILCITFTKAAAANMSERVFSKLGRWVTLPDDELAREMQDAGEANPHAQAKARARELFACALETPGGLKVQTIHALCTRLLQQFPFEAKVPAHFSVLDDRDQNEIMERANLSVLTDAARAPQSPEGRALQFAMATAADVTFNDVVREACLSRGRFMAFADRADSVDAAIAQVALALGVSVEERVEDVESEIVNGPHLPRGEWIKLAKKFDAGGDNDKKQSNRLHLASSQSGPEQVDSYLGLFLTEKLEARAHIATKKIKDADPDFFLLLEKEKERITGLIGRRRALVQRDRTRALLTIAKAVSDNYRREKRERGLLDYDDLIDKTFDLLNDGASGWVHFKLDRGIDHVLVDEAQDTSPKQWDIIQKLIEEFWSGAGARDGVKRTIFAVGDEKQSIFSFQGAAPREFDLRRRELENFFKQAGLGFKNINLKHSFRSGKAILSAVDHVFREQNIYESIHAAGAHPVHDALSDASPALIDLWELEEAEESDNPGGWAAPVDALPESSPEAVLARRVQAEISALIGNGAAKGTADRRRPISYGDILILVRRRGRAFDAVIHALKRAGIPVAGADRLRLTEHIAIIDLMNLADALLLPADDLALAVALKSPLLGLDDDDLLKFAPLRSRTLREAFEVSAASDRKLESALDLLLEMENRAASETPFAFYSWLLSENGARSRILRRLGPEANDAIDEFLELSLSYEQKAPASLQGFMSWLRAAETEVKRDMDVGRDEVRVMTVHGAKGLEASVVFLIDTTTSPTDTQRQSLIHLPQGNADPHSVGVVVWAGSKKDDPETVAKERKRGSDETEDEYRRLLYVAMTRAADRLIVGGVLPGNRNSVRELSWYDLIAKGLSKSGLVKKIVETSYGPVARHTHADDVEPAAQKISKAPAKSDRSPDWLKIPAAAEKSAEASLRPSEFADVEGHAVVTAESLAARAKALQRGALVHRLLQLLPEVASARRLEAAKKFLARNADDLNETEREGILKQVIKIVENEQFEPLFAEGSRAEVSVVGRVERRGASSALVSGQIDRMVLTPKEILIVDYKTNHMPPESAAEVPRAYVHQLALYRRVLAQLYPDKKVRCALIWTETASVMEIPAPALDAELQSITG